jgi:hypothetical protein
MPLVAFEVYQMGVDFGVFQFLVSQQPQSIDKLCTSAGISKRTFYYKRPELEKSGIIREVEGGYALWTYVEAEQTVIKTIQQWKKIAFCNPTPMEIADETGLSPATAETLARKTQGKTGWAMPNDAVKQSAAEKLGEVLVCAARIRNGEISNFDYENDAEIVEEAEVRLKTQPQMLPRLAEDGEEVVSWPSEALKYLGETRQPKDRHKTAFFVVRP